MNLCAGIFARGVWAAW